MGECKETVCPLYFIDSDKISDVLMVLSKDMTLRFNVRLASKGWDGKRKPAVSEIRYDVNKYTDAVTAVEKYLDDAYSI